jgi:CIC family chloride channel protein
VLESVKFFALGATGDLSEIAEHLAPWQRVLAPTLGGLVAGLVLQWGLRDARNSAAGNLLEVVIAGDGRLPFGAALVKSLSSVLSVGTGASIGREGAIAQMTATVASGWGQLRKWQPYRLRLVVACGAASGIAAAYNAPIGGAVFAAQVVLGNFSMNLFGPLVFASVVASVLSRSFFGIEPWYRVPDFDFTRLSQLPWFLLLGLGAGVVGALFLKSLKWSEAGFKRLPLPLCARLAAGGLVVGLVAVGCPQVWGNGAGVTTQILHEALPLGVLLGWFAAKWFATVSSVGRGRWAEFSRRRFFSARRWEVRLEG